MDYYLEETANGPVIWAEGDGRVLKALPKEAQGGRLSPGIPTTRFVHIAHAVPPHVRDANKGLSALEAQAILGYILPFEPADETGQ